MVDWYQRTISSALGEPPQDGLLPMHGDFAPWNVRVLPDGRIAVIDWEHAAWGPPDADLAYLDAASRAMRGKSSLQSLSPEARAFWRRRLELSNPSARRDQVLRDRMLAALADE